MLRCRLARNPGGQSTVELVMSMISFVMILLALIDMISIVGHIAVNEKVARNAARVASTQHRELSAQAAARKVVNSQQLPPHCTGFEVERMRFNSLNSGLVSVEVKMSYRLPIAIAGWDEIKLMSESTVPITSFLDRAEASGMQ